MAWRDELQPGRFRDATFKIESGEQAGGRRLAVHTYPGRDLPYPEDLGRGPREFSLDLYVLGADYMRARDALIDALEQSGPGTLVHPYRGAMRVNVMEFRVRESTREGGLARFLCRFIEAGEPVEPAEQVNTQALVDTRASAAQAAAEAAFADGFSVTGAPAFVAEQATELLSDAISTLDALRAGFPAVPTKAFEFQRLLTSVSSAAADLIRDPVQLARQVTGLFRGFTGLLDAPAAALDQFRSLFLYGDGIAAIPETTPARRQQSLNQAAMLALVRSAAVSEAGRAARLINFQSYDEAAAIRDELADAIDGLATAAGDDLFAALNDLRAGLVRDITVRGADIGRLVDWTPPATLPALYIAHRLYGDARRADEIVARNHVQHPGFVPGGVSLEVLTRV